MHNPDKPRWKSILNSLNKEGITLDLGSSQGDMHKWLIKNHRGKILGVDSDCGDVVHDLNKKFPFRSEYASNIIAGEIIEHMHEPFFFLMECNRVLKKNGRLIITTPNAIGFHYLVNERHGYDLGYTPHLYAWNKTMLKELVMMTGFRIVRIETINHFTNSNPILRYLSQAICFAIPRIRPKLFLVAEKI